MDRWSEQQIAQGKEENRALKYFQSEDGEAVIKISWTREAFEKNVFIDPILDKEDNYEDQRYIRNDVRVE